MKQTEKDLANYYRRKKEENDKKIANKKASKKEKEFNKLKKEAEKKAQAEYNRNEAKPLFINGGSKYLPQKSI